MRGAVVLAWFVSLPAAFAQPQALPPSTLAEAAVQADSTAVKKLLDGGADPNGRDENGATALMLAVSSEARSAKGNPAAVVRLLLAQGADPNLADPDGRTPLHEASLGSHTESRIVPPQQALIDMLLRAGARVDTQDNEGKTALMILAWDFDTQPRVLQLFFNRGAKVNLADHKGRTALMNAAEFGRTDTVALLMAAGADPKLRDSKGQTALDLATEGGYPDTVAKLFAGSAAARHQAMQKARDLGLLRAIAHTDYEKAADMLAHGASPDAQEGGVPALVAAAHNTSGDDLVKLLVQHGANVNAAGPDGVTPLMAAASHYGHAACELLIAHGAKVDARDARGDTALMMAAGAADDSMEERFHLLERLLSLGADPNAQGYLGVMPLMLAARRASGRAIELLMDRGADANAADQAGRTVLMIAVRQGAPAIVDYLLRHKADVNARDRSGRSVLLVAIDAPEHFSYEHQEIYDPETVRMLIEQGGPINAASQYGDTPLLAALRRHYWNVVELLLQHGADVTVRDRSGKTAVELAAGTPVEQVVREAAGK